MPLLLFRLSVALLCVVSKGLPMHYSVYAALSINLEVLLVTSLAAGPPTFSRFIPSDAVNTRGSMQKMAWDCLAASLRFLDVGSSQHLWWGFILTFLTDTSC